MSTFSLVIVLILLVIGYVVTLGWIGLSIYLLYTSIKDRDGFDIGLTIGYLFLGVILIIALTVRGLFRVLPYLPF